MCFEFFIALRQASIPFLEIRSAGSIPSGKVATFTSIPRDRAILPARPVAEIPALSSSKDKTRLLDSRRTRPKFETAFSLEISESERAVPEVAMVFLYMA